MEVRSAEEILATLDEQGCLDALPFMPEMLQYCGKRFRVFKVAHKTCDTIKDWTTMRRMTNAVHLEGLRCDGKSHGGCQAGCLLFWKEAWLKSVRGPKSGAEMDAEKQPQGTDVGSRSAGFRCTLEILGLATRVLDVEGEDTEEQYRCQATELLRATTPIKGRNPQQYIQDLVSGNVRLNDFVRYGMIAVFNIIMRLHWRGRPYPYIRGLAKKKTPTEVLNLQAGELVQVRSKDEIMCTLNEWQRNRGLWFDVEMVPYCGRNFRVLRRVDRFLDEKTGKMIRLLNPCIILEGVTCSGCLSRHRLFCPRSIYPYWHEIWLKRVDETESRSGDSAHSLGETHAIMDHS